MHAITVAAAAILSLTLSAMAQNVDGGPETAREVKLPATPPANSPATPPAAKSEPADKKFTVSGGYLHQFNTSLNTGGNYAADRAYAAFASRYQLSETLRLDVDLGYEFDHYQFHGTAQGLGSTLNTETLSVVPRFTVSLDDHWTVSAAPVLQLSGESQANAGDTITGGAIGSFRYAFDDTHVLGLGLLVKNMLGSGVLVVPAPLVDWEIKKGLRLSNIRSPEANPFVSIELEQELSEQFDIALGGAWQFRQSRLEDSGANPNGVFQESNTAIYGRFEWHPIPSLRMDLLVGTAIYSRVKTLDGGGNTLTSTGGDPSLVLGAFISYKF